MPNYSWLRPRDSDSAETLSTKKRTTGRLQALRGALRNHINQAELVECSTHVDSKNYVRLATWNIQAFDSAGYGFRSQESLSYIAEIISHFDLIALQEIKRDLTALNKLTKLLGPSWTYIATDVTEGSSGNRERMAFLYNRQKVSFRNVTGELTLPQGQKVSDPFGDRVRVEGGAHLNLPAGESLESPTGIRTKTLASGETKIDEDVEIELPADTQLTLPAGSILRFSKNARLPITPGQGIDLDNSNTPHLPEAAEIVLPPNSLVGGPRQFARTPFIASFQAGWLKINLATVHIYFGSGTAGLDRRKAEIRRLTELLGQKASSDSDSDADAYFIALGDFNIVHPNHETMQALLTNNFIIPEPLQEIPGSNVKKDKYYDQIAIWNGNSRRTSSYSRIQAYRAGVFDFFETVFRLEDEATYQPLMKKPDSDEFYSSYSRWRTQQMSDHLPMWVELHSDFTEDYLSMVAESLEDVDS